MKSEKGYKLKRKILRENGKKKIDFFKKSMHNRFHKLIFFFFLNWKEKKIFQRLLRKGKKNTVMKRSYSGKCQIH